MAGSKSFIKPVVFRQTSEPWGKRMYSNHNDPRQTMASSGSAPTLCADVVATLKDKNVDPWALAQLSLEWGCRTRMSGTSWDFFEKAAKYYNFSKFVRSREWTDIVNCLDAGGYVICCVKRGYWSRVGNYILAWKYDSKYVFCIGTERREGKQSVEAFISELKMCFCFYPDDKIRPMTELMSEDDVLFAVDNRFPFVLESRKLGIIGNAYTAAGAVDFFTWFRGWYINHGDDEYGHDWRCWYEPPTEELRRTTPWERRHTA